MTQNSKQSWCAVVD